MWGWVLLAVGCDVLVASPDLRRDALGQVSSSLEALGPIRDFTNRGQDCVLLDDGSIQCWYDSFVGSDGPESEPSGAFSKIFSGEKHVCAIRESGQADCWGSENEFEGSNAEQAFYAGPVTDMRVGASLTCARTQGAWSCSGMQTSFVDHLDQPMKLDGLNIVDLDASETICAIVDQEVRCWGQFAGEQAGPEWFTKADEPRTVRVGSGRDVCVIDDADDLWCAWNSVRGPGIDEVELVAQNVEAITVPRYDLKAHEGQICWLSNGTLDCAGEELPTELADSVPIEGPFGKIDGRADRFVCATVQGTRLYRCFGNPQFAQ